MCAWFAFFCVCVCDHISEEILFTWEELEFLQHLLGLLWAFREKYNWLHALGSWECPNILMAFCSPSLILSHLFAFGLFWVFFPLKFMFIVMVLTIMFVLAFSWTGCAVHFYFLFKSSLLTDYCRRYSALTRVSCTCISLLDCILK